MTDQAIKFCAYYLSNQCHSNPEILDQAMGILMGGSNLHSYTPEVNAQCFDEEYANAFRSETLYTFVQNLFELIPLQKFAEFRLNADLITLVDVLNNALDPNDQFFHAPIHGHTGYENYIFRLNQWLETKKDKLQSLRTLDLSQTKIQRIPQAILPYLSGIQEASLHNAGIEDPTILIDLLQLPGIEHLDFSSNIFGDDAKFEEIKERPLLRAIANAKHLKTLNLAGNCIRYQEAADLIKVCSDRSIDLILDVFSDQEEDYAYLCSKINEQLPENAKILIPSSSFADESQFLEKIRESALSRTEHMQTIEELDLSQSYMTSFPEELLPCLCSLKSVIFKENHYGDVDLFPAIVSLLQLETLESLVLSSNNIDAEFLNRLTPHILASKSLKEINLANNPFKIEECPDFIQACLSKGINIIYSLPKSQRIFITFINSLELTTTAQKYTAKAYQTLTSLLPAIFSDDLSYWDISKASTAEIPQEVLPYLSKLKAVKFSESQSSRENIVSMIQSILSLPSIECVDFSSNNLSDEDLISLTEDFQQVPSLKYINLSNNPLNPTMHEGFLRHCKEKGITLIRPLFKKEVDFLNILGKIQQQVSLPEALIPASFVDEKHIIEQVSLVLEKFKDAIKSITHLDFSDVKVERFPSILIPYLTGVTTVCLKNTTPDPDPNRTIPYLTKSHQLLANIVNLPNLEEIDLSNNSLNHSSFICLEQLIINPQKKIKKIKIANCSYKPEFLKHLQQICLEQGVSLVRTFSKQELGLVKTVQKINKALPTEHQIFIPTNFVSYQDCIDQMAHSLQREKTQLGQLTKLDLSNTTVEEFPREILTYLIGVKQVSLRNIYKKAPENFNALNGLYALPNLESINLSWNHLDMPNKSSLFIAFLRNFSKIRDLDLTHSDADPSNAKALVEFCSARGINCKIETV